MNCNPLQFANYRGQRRDYMCIFIYAMNRAAPHCRSWNYTTACWLWELLRRAIKELMGTLQRVVWHVCLAVNIAGYLCRKCVFVAQVLCLFETCPCLFGISATCDFLFFWNHPPTQLHYTSNYTRHHTCLGPRQYTSQRSARSLPVMNGPITFSFLKKQSFKNLTKLPQQCVRSVKSSKIRWGVIEKLKGPTYCT